MKEEPTLPEDATIFADSSWERGLGPKCLHLIRNKSFPSMRPLHGLLNQNICNKEERLISQPQRQDYHLPTGVLKVNVLHIQMG